MEKRNELGNIIENTIGIIFALLFLQIVNVYYKDIPFLTSDFTKVIPLYNISLGVGILFHIFNILLRNKYTKSIFELISNGIFLLLAYNLWIVFPFDTSFIGNSSLWDQIFRMLILFPAFGVTISILVNTAKLLSFESKSTDTKKS